MASPVGETITLAEGFVLADYKVLKFIANGAFGAVYEVEHINGLRYGLKIENRDTTTKNLKMEAVVIKALEPLRSPYFCQPSLCGRTEKFDFIVMTLVGRNLNELRTTSPSQRFSTFTGVHVGLQVVTAIQQLHSIGYIHRDIKPGNFCVSLSDPRQLVMVDFGLCRKYTENDELLRRPRWFVRGFKGTVRYASLNVHHGKETSRIDDLESALYLLVELLVGTLPWTMMEDVVHVEHSKQIARTSGMKDFLSGCPKQLIHLMMYIDSLKFYDVPDYALIRGLLTKSLEKCPEKWEFEWEKEERERAAQKKNRAIEMAKG